MRVLHRCTSGGPAAASTGIDLHATARPHFVHPRDKTTSKGEPADRRANGRLHLLNRTYEGQAASTLALSCSNSAWVMAPLSRRPLADAISSAALLEDPAATDLT